MRDTHGNLVRKAWPYEYWVDKGRFIDAVIAGLTEEQQTAMNANPKVTMAIAYLPGSDLDILHPRVAAFLALAGTTVNGIMERMGLEFPPDPTEQPEEPGVLTMED